MITSWIRDREAWTFIARRYLPWLAGLNVAWETVQLPLYTTCLSVKHHSRLH